MSFCLQKHFHLNNFHSLNIVTHTDNHDAAQEGQEGSWCPPIYFNYKCYSASFLSRARLASLPKKVGPGSVQLVLREVLNLIIGSSFKSGSVLKRLEVKSDLTAAASADFVIAKSSNVNPEC